MFEVMFVPKTRALANSVTDSDKTATERYFSSAGYDLRGNWVFVCALIRIIDGGAMVQHVAQLCETTPPFPFQYAIPGARKTP